MSITKKQITYCFLILAVLVPGLFLVNKAFSSTTSGTIDAVERYAWSENVGWLDFGTSLGNVKVTDADLTGYAYGENIGWISLNCSNNSSCGVVDYGVSNDGEGNLSGYAWGENTGWIDFDPQGGGVAINGSGEFTGYAYAENIGWISFNCLDANSCATASYRVKTDWRAQSLRPACNNALDDDGDGLIDYPADGGCSDLNDDNEVNGVAFVAPPKPNIQNVSITPDGDALEFKNLPANIIQIAVSLTSDFNNTSWEDIAKKEEILNRYVNAEKLYIKFRTNKGAVSDVMIYEPNSVSQVEVPAGNVSNSNENTSIPVGQSAPSSSSPAGSETNPAISVAFAKSFSLGDNGSEVKSLQVFLRQLNFFPQDVEANGNFGPATLQAVKDFQKANGINPTGFVGPVTLKALNGQQIVSKSDYEFNQDLKYGDKNEDVKQLQNNLKDRAFFPKTVPSTGFFGPITERAVNLFKKIYNLIPDGLVDEDMRGVLNK